MSSTSEEVLEYRLGGIRVPLRRYWRGCGMLKKGEFRLSMVCVVDVFMC